MLSRMIPKPPVQDRPNAHRFELNLKEIGQLFITINPSAFPEKDLDREAAALEATVIEITNSSV